jgi:predicted kinase
MRVIFTVGVSASGKSTWTESFIKSNPGFIEINRDNTRKAIYKEKTGETFTWAAWKPKWEKEVNEIQDFQIASAIRNQTSIIISDTNLNIKKLSAKIEMFESNGYDVDLLPFPISFDEAVQRDTDRLNGVGAFVIRKQWKDWVEFSNNTELSQHLIGSAGMFPQHYHTLTKTDCLVFDIDGTIAHMNNRSPFDWGAVRNDTPDPIMVFLISSWLIQNSNKVVFLSGRDSVCQQETMAWISKHFNNVRFGVACPNAILLMRPEGSTEKDTSVKKDLLLRHVDSVYNVLAVFDDRPSVVRMWHDMGLKVWSTGDQLVQF